MSSTTLIQRPALRVSHFRCTAVAGDKPFVEQYTAYLGDTVRGDLGDSLQYFRSNAELIGSRQASKKPPRGFESGAETARSRNPLEEVACGQW